MHLRKWLKLVLLFESTFKFPWRRLVGSGPQASRVNDAHRAMTWVNRERRKPSVTPRCLKKLKAPHVLHSKFWESFKISHRGNHTDSPQNQNMISKYAIHRIAERLHVMATRSSWQWHAGRAAASMPKGNSSTACVSSGACSIQGSCHESCLSHCWLRVRSGRGHLQERQRGNAFFDMQWKWPNLTKSLQSPSARANPIRVSMNSELRSLLKQHCPFSLSRE